MTVTQAEIHGQERLKNNAWLPVCIDILFIYYKMREARLSQEVRSMFHIVDDIPELRDVLNELVVSAGYGAMQFDSAEAYLEYLNSDAFIAPVAILTDYLMGGKTGLQLVRKIRQQLPFQKAVIISGTPCSEWNANIESALCYSLTKPYRIEKLFSLLEALEKCDQHCQPNRANFQQPRCQYGLEHECPFYPA